MAPNSVRKTPAWFAIAVAAVAVAFFGVVCSPIVPYAKIHDFLSFYTGAQLVSTGQTDRLYDVALQTQIQMAESKGELPVLAPYIRPPHFAWSTQWLAWMSLDTAFAVWLALHISLAFGAWYWAGRRFGADAVIYCSFFIATGYGILNGQDCAAVLWLVLGAYLAAEKGRDELAGFLVGCTLFKFHMLILLPVAMLLRKRWRMLGGYAAAGAMQAGLSLWIIGWSGVPNYVAILTSKDLIALHPSLHLMVSIAGLTSNLGVENAVLNAILSLGAAAAALAVGRDAPLFRWFYGAAAGSIVITSHAYQYDLALLLPPALMLLFGESTRAERTVAAIMLTPAAFVMTMLGKPWSIAPALVTLAFFLVLTHPDLVARMFGAREHTRIPRVAATPS